ncbi:MAG: GIY-YIG nuclease family protein [Colwellia sp.]|nr:GIY-YIG nuclease family protein [Colwellia sp.]MCW8864914.1 GIY-YIG nuclease family protein [Colwellia sp.]MCW9080532.1 GIY-YIG nuclease family protein [Colwellia sp.]
MENSPHTTEDKQVSVGNVYVMTHSFFSDVIRIGCTPEDPSEYAMALSSKSPGEYSLVFSLQCNNPCKVKKQIREHLNAKEYVNEFYQVPAEVAKSLVKREGLRIPALSTE